MSFDATQCQVWLDALDGGGDSAQPLCEHHATRITPPRGWVMVDRRTAQSSLLTGPAAEPQRRPRQRSSTSTRQWGSFEAPTLEFDAADSESLNPAVATPVASEPQRPLDVDQPAAVHEAPLEPEVVDEAPRTESDRPTPADDTTDVAPTEDEQPDVAAAGDTTADRAGSTLSGAKGRLLSRAFEASGVDEELSRKFFGTSGDQDS